MSKTQSAGKGAPPQQPPKAPPVADEEFSYDPDDITLKITTDEGTETVTIPFDFSDFSEEESLRVRALTAGDSDVAKTMSGFLFVAACRQVDFTDEAFAGFHSELSRLWDHDPSILEVV